MRRLFAFATVLLLTAPAWASGAHTLTWSDSELRFDLPAGLCSIDKNDNSTEDVIFEAMSQNYEPESMLHLMAIPCSARDRVRDPGDDLIDFSFDHWFLIFSPRDELPGGISRKTYLAEAARFFAMLDFGDFIGSLNTKINDNELMQLSGGVTVSELARVGEVTTDEAAVYIRVATFMQTVEGENPVAGVMGTTLVLGDDIAAAAYSNIAPGFSYEPLEAEIEVFMNDLVTINGTPADLSGSSGSDYDSGDYKTAFEEWLSLAEQGDVDAQYNLALMYDLGEGVPVNDAEAVKWYRLAAEQGLVDAQYNLAVMYGNGFGVLQDYAEAVKWYRLAAEQGDADAQYNLALMYYYGDGVPVNYVQAYKWVSLSAALGSEVAREAVDIIASGMTHNQIAEAEAQRLAAEWWEDYQSRQ